MRAIQDKGVRQINGDILLDNTIFRLPGARRRRL